MTTELSPPVWDALTETVWPNEHVRPIREGLAYVTQRFRDLPRSDAQPIFVVGSAWRSGSTLVQRLVNSDRDACIFGETYEQMLLWHQLAGQWRGFGAGDELHSAYLPDAAIDPVILHSVLTEQFPATLSPRVADLKAAHYAFVEALLERPAKRLSRPRWGMKLVRADAVVLDYLTFLYPKARLLFVVRHPLECWRSYEAAIKSEGRPWDLRAGSHRIETATQFALVWRRSAMAMLERRADANVFLLPYESIRREMPLTPIEDFLGLRLDPAVLRIMSGRSQSKQPAGSSDARRIAEICAEPMQVLGYT